MNDTDLHYLRRCVDLARDAVAAGDQPFGSLLVSSSGEILFEDRNRTRSGNDATLHPEFAIAKWAAANLPPQERRTATVYTSGEHCAMCAAAHALVGLGRIVFASSTQQLGEWRRELGRPSLGIQSLPIPAVIENAQVDGPVPALAQEIRALHVAAAQAAGAVS